MKTNYEIDALISKEIKALTKEHSRIPEGAEKDEVYHEIVVLKKLQAKIHKPAKIKEPVVIKIRDFTRDKHEPAYDVECYINGKFDGTHDGVFSTRKESQYLKQESIKKNAYQLALKYSMNKLNQILNKT